MQYKCNVCGMTIKGLHCGDCGKELVLDTILNEDNTEVQVAKCPGGCGKIKSPTCCGQDMVTEASVSE